MSFDSKEIARLIDAFRALERRDPEGIEGQLEDYLFAHRESILARLEAADALAEWVETMATGNVWNSVETAKYALAAYKKAKGA